MNTLDDALYKVGIKKSNFIIRMSETGMNEIEESSLSERAYTAVRCAILYGDLLPGERLRPSELQESLGLGLTPIREALTRLSVEGLLTGQTNRGVWVKSVSLDELEDVTTARLEIEQACLNRAIMNGDATWESHIVATCHLLSRTPLPSGLKDRAGIALWEQRHRAFHFALVEACGSQWLLKTWNTLTDQSERYRALRLVRRKEVAAEVRDVVAEHEEIMKAVVARDKARTVALMTAHLRATASAVARLLSTDGNRSRSRQRRKLTR